MLRGCDLTFTGDRDVMPSLMESSLSPSAIHSRSLGRILPPCDKILQGSSITTNFLHCFFSKGVLLFLKELLRYTIQRYYIAPLPRDCPLLSGPLNFLKVLFSKSFNHLCGKKLSSHAFLSHSGWGTGWPKSCGSYWYVSTQVRPSRFKLKCSCGLVMSFWKPTITKHS